jgi:hypothetical protein
VNEEDMFSNGRGCFGGVGNNVVDYSPQFTEFLNFLGTTIDLKGWDKFRGGLDVKSKVYKLTGVIRGYLGGFTGDKSVYTTFHDFEVMFHVAPFLPYSHTDRQQVR